MKHNISTTVDYNKSNTMKHVYIKSVLISKVRTLSNRQTQNAFI
jgi:hypothetical protein